jgi:hypothetical protein
MCSLKANANHGCSFLVHIAKKGVRKHAENIVLVIVAIAIVGTTAFISDKSLGITSGKAAGQLIHAQTEEFCGTKVDSDTSTELAKTESARKRFLANKQAPPTSLVNVHFHVIQSADAGAIDDANIALQMDVLKYSFSAWLIVFACNSRAHLKQQLVPGLRRWAGKENEASFAHRYRNRPQCLHLRANEIPRTSYFPVAVRSLT